MSGLLHRERKIIINQQYNMVLSQNVSLCAGSSVNACIMQANVNIIGPHSDITFLTFMGTIHHTHHLKLIKYFYSFAVFVVG